MASLTINDLHKSFGSVEVLKGINLHIENGGFLVFVFYVLFFSFIFKLFGLKTLFFELLQAKPCRTIMKLPQQVSFGPEASEILPKVWFLASGFCLLRLREP